MTSGKNYAAVIDRSIGSVYQTGVANKILQYATLLRNSSDLSRARRWGSELLQNSRDAAYADIPVSVKILLTENYLSFSHNGRPFRVSDVLSIINQVSSKSDDGTTVGKFGTGFMTTLQLSENIRLRSVLSDCGLPYKPFSITLDRRGQTKEEIFAAIEKTTAELRLVDEAESVNDFDKSAFNTEFIYSLETEQSKLCALTGTDDMVHSVLYTLLFSDKIEQIEICYDLPDKKESVRYRRNSSETNENGLMCTVISETVSEGDNETRTDYCLYHLSSDGITVAAATDENRHFLKINEKTSRIFIDFPLIGSERFPFPVVVNSREFRPDEPRKSISLVDNENSADSVINKELMQKAVSLYSRFIKTVSSENFSGVENILYLPECPLSSEMSSSWLDNHIQSLYDTISGVPVIPSENGLIPVSDKEFVFTEAESREERSEISDILSYLNGFKYASDDTDWYSVFKNYRIPETKTISAAKLLENAEYMVNYRLRSDIISYPEWCRKVYILCLAKPELEVLVKAGKVKIFPSQYIYRGLSTSIVLYTAGEIKNDPGIPEVLKKTADYLDRISPSDSASPYTKLKIRNQLLHQTFTGITECENYSTDTLYSYISVKSSRLFPVRSFIMNSRMYIDSWRNSWKLLLSCSGDEEMYRLAEIIYTDMPEYNPLPETVAHSLWKNTFVSVLNELCEFIEKCGSTDKFISQNPCIDSREKFTEYFNLLVSKLNQYSLQSVGTHRIFPDMNGDFHHLSGLHANKISFPEFIDIVESFADMSTERTRYDIRRHLLDRNIASDSLSIPACDNRKISADINLILQTILSSHSLSAESELHQNACMTLLAWIDNHPDTAKEYFPAFSSDEDKMKLLTPRAAARIKQRADQFESIISEYGIRDTEELISYIKDSRSRNNIPDSEKYSTEYDVSYGDEFSGMPEHEIDAFLRKIGKSGEIFFVNRLKDSWTEKGYEVTEACDSCITLKKDESIVTISYPDASGKNQPGWDVCVTESDSPSGSVFYEVKTHTQKSMLRNTVRLSGEQMKKALAEKERYNLALISFNTGTSTCELINILNNPPALIAAGELRAESGYRFSIG
ncbi:MAG: hypothetical protein PUE12_02635 [Oscillospiraceae bacterium]|nr:hypothetical protein [Oscillospiraceae bacterium]